MPPSPHHAASTGRNGGLGSPFRPACRASWRSGVQAAEIGGLDPWAPGHGWPSLGTEGTSDGRVERKSLMLRFPKCTSDAAVITTEAAITATGLL